LLRVATSLPGLRNDRARDLLEATPTIADTNLARDIRKVAAEIAPKADQHDADTESRLDVLENRLRTAPRTEAPENGSPAASSPASSPGSRPPRGAQRPAAGPHGPATTLDPNVRRPLPRQAATHEGPAHPVAYGPAGALIGLVTAIRALGTRPNSGRSLPWDGPPDSLAGRHQTFEREIMAQRRQNQSLKAAEKSGRAALEALRAFTNGTGAAILTRIDDAAKATPGGLPEVLAQMRDGGRFADLRREFNGTLAAEKGFAAAYDTTTNALAQYGGQRAAIAPLLAGKAGAATALGRFEALDAELGQAAANLPGRADGKSAFDELGEKTREIIQVALDAVRNAFVRGASAQTTNGPAAAPGSGT
jgi:hypothetical protein